MRTLSVAFVFAGLCTSAYAQVDADTLRKLVALKSLALLPDRISPQQVSTALAVKLDKHCADVTQPGAGKYHVCGYAPAEADNQPLAFRYYKTVNRTAAEDTGGVVAFMTQGDQTCMRTNDLVSVFQITPVASDSPALPEPTLPYIPVRTYQFVFPKQGDSEVHIRVVQTGDCINTVELSKSSYREKTKR